MFVTATDYKVVIGAAALAVVTQTDQANRENAEKEAVEEISGYLRPQYDCEAIFSATGDDRNSQMVMFTCDIALYHMTASTSRGMGSDVRKERYERAIKWLESVQAGKIRPELPTATNEQGEEIVRTHYGSAPQLKSIW